MWAGTGNRKRRTSRICLNWESQDMTDIFTPAKRSEVMSRVRGRDTGPEMAVRRLVYALGYRYRLHVRSLPGRPDLVFPSRWRIIFVHGCFWHRHGCRRGQSIPESNQRFWQRKLNANRNRDSRQRRQLRRQGWRVLVIWECQVRNSAFVRRRISAFLGPA